MSDPLTASLTRTTVAYDAATQQAGSAESWSKAAAATQPQAGQLERHTVVSTTKPMTADQSSRPMRYADEQPTSSSGKTGFFSFSRDTKIIAGLAVLALAVAGVVGYYVGTSTWAASEKYGLITGVVVTVTALALGILLIKKNNSVAEFFNKNQRNKAITILALAALAVVLGVTAHMGIYNHAEQLRNYGNIQAAGLATGFVVTPLAIAAAILAKIWGKKVATRLTMNERDQREWINWKTVTVAIVLVGIILATAILAHHNTFGANELVEKGFSHWKGWILPVSIGVVIGILLAFVKPKWMQSEEELREAAGTAPAIDDAGATQTQTRLTQSEVDNKNHASNSSPHPLPALVAPNSAGTVVYDGNGGIAGMTLGGLSATAPHATVVTFVAPVVPANPIGGDSAVQSQFATAGGASPTTTTLTSQQST